MSNSLTPADLAAESGTALPGKEVMSLLDLNANVDLGLDLAAPVDLAVAANLNVAAPDRRGRVGQRPVASARTPPPLRRSRP